MHSTEWAAIPHFLAVARSGSLRAAAKISGETHTKIDRSIKILEHHYGAELFIRSRRGFRLTQAGTALLPEAEAAERQMFSARRRVEAKHQDVAGTVRISASNWLAFHFIAPMLPKFRDLYPEIDLSFLVTDRYQDLARAETDISLRFAFDIGPEETGRRLFHCDTTIMASKAYLDRYMSHAGPDGEGLHWINWTGIDYGEFWQQLAPYPEAALVHDVSDGLMWIHMVAQGQGMAMAMPVAAHHMFPVITRVSDAPIKPGRSLWVMFHSDFKKTKRVRAVADFLSDEFLSIKHKFVAGGELGG